MARKVDLAIIGAGSGGISAARRADRAGVDFVLIDRGPLGTTCARVGCMPSKVLIHAANAFHSRKSFTSLGISGADGISCDIPAVLSHVRSLRDKFAGGMADTVHDLAGDRLVMGTAHILDPNHVEVDGDVYETKRIIIATGASPFVPDDWQTRFKGRIMTSESFFEQETLPRRMAVIGLGAIGLELGQAMSRLGIEVHGFSTSKFIGGLSDPKVNAAAHEAISHEFPMHMGAAAEVEEDGEALRVSAGGNSATVDGILVSAGTRPNLKGIGMENLGVPLDKRGVPESCPHTMQIGALPVYIAGDASGSRAVLHEALDEGFIAGHNASSGKSERHCRRTGLRITFSEPQIFAAGVPFRELGDADFVAGEVDFATQSRALIEGNNSGLLRIYAERATGIVLGAEGACPAGEHFAHELAWAIQGKSTVSDMLQRPFYHPVGEEALRSALRDLGRQLAPELAKGELTLCCSTPEAPLC